MLKGVQSRFLRWVSDCSPSHPFANAPQTKTCLWGPRKKAKGWGTERVLKQAVRVLLCFYQFSDQGVAALICHCICIAQHQEPRDHRNSSEHEEHGRSQPESIENGAETDDADADAENRCLNQHAEERVCL